VTAIRNSPGELVAERAKFSLSVRCVFRWKVGKPPPHRLYSKRRTSEVLPSIERISLVPNKEIN
jgi:hypothetical protein